MKSKGISIPLWATKGVACSLRRSIILKAPVVSTLALFSSSSPAQACIPSMWFGLSYLSFLFPLVLTQAMYCVCSAEQPAIKALCVCVFVPARLSDCVNPWEALVTSSLPSLPPPPPRSHHLLPMCQLRLAHFSFSGIWYALSPATYCLVPSLLANQKKGNPLLTSLVQTAIRSQRVSQPLGHQFPWCFAADQCLSRGIRRWKTKEGMSVLLPRSSTFTYLAGGQRS